MKHYIIIRQVVNEFSGNMDYIKLSIPIEVFIMSWVKKNYVNLSDLRAVM